MLFNQAQRRQQISGKHKLALGFTVTSFMMHLLYLFWSPKELKGWGNVWLIIEIPIDFASKKAEHFKEAKLLNIVGRGDWLGNAANFKEVCLCCGFDLVSSTIVLTMPQLTMVRASRGHGLKPRWSRELFWLLYPIAKIALITARIVALLDFISTIQYMIHFIYIISFNDVFIWRNWFLIWFGHAHSHYLDVVKKILVLFRYCSFLSTRERSQIITLICETHGEIWKTFANESNP